MIAECARPGTVLLGLGNPILGDDGIGCLLARQIGELAMETVSVISTSFSPIRLLDEITGHDRLIVIDSITTGEHPVGTLMEVELGRPRMDHLPITAHHFSIDQVLEAGSRMGMDMPSTVRIYGIEIEPPLVYGDRISPDLLELLPGIANEIKRMEFDDPPFGGSPTTREEIPHDEPE